MGGITYGTGGTITVPTGWVTYSSGAADSTTLPTALQVQSFEIKVQNRVEQLMTVDSYSTGSAGSLVTGTAIGVNVSSGNAATTAATGFSVDHHGWLFNPGGKQWLQNNAWTWKDNSWNDDSTCGFTANDWAHDTQTCARTIKCWISAADTAVTCYGQWTQDGRYMQWKPESPKDKLRRIIRERYAPAVIIKGRVVEDRLDSAEDIREERARQTLRKVAGPVEFRRFLSRGFVLIRGKSGDVYQCWPGDFQESITKVWRQGVAIERLCVVLSGGFPPTDSLIMRCLILMNDEAQFRALANVHKVARQTHRAEMADPHAGKSLVEIYRSIKAGNAV